MTEPHPTRVLHHGNHHMTPVTTRQTQKRTIIIYLKMRQQQRHRTRADRRHPFYAERRSVSWVLGPVPQGNFPPSSCSLFTCRAKGYRQTSTTAIRNHATRHTPQCANADTALNTIVGLHHCDRCSKYFQSRNAFHCSSLPGTTVCDHNLSANCTYNLH